MQGKLFLILQAVGIHRFELQGMATQTVLDSAITISASKNLPLIPARPEGTDTNLLKS